MMRLFINGLSGSAGGGLTYIRNAIPQFAAAPEVQVTLAVPPGLGSDFRGSNNVEVLELRMSTARRFWFEQAQLPALLRKRKSDVLLSIGNFALRSSPVPQILLSRNSIYTSPDFFRDLWSRGEYFLWIDTHVRGGLAKRSIRWADVTVAPSEAFASQLHRVTGVDVRAIHHGFDLEAFTGNKNPLPDSVLKQVKAAEGSLKILFVSHYNYYRNFETLLRALPLVRRALPNRTIKLLLTCRLRAGENPGAYNPDAAARLVSDLKLSDTVVELGTVPYNQLHQLYRCADVYVTPAYTETFAHPLVEAMASGIPIVASDLEVHREICAAAAVYFPCFSPELLAQRVSEVTASSEVSRRMTAAGLARACQFSWKRHVESILNLAAGLVASK